MISPNEAAEGVMIVFYTVLPFAVIAIVVATAWFALKIASRHVPRLKKVLERIEK
mgnify:CR=1 FL=1|jgi:riboflavin transporter FmnP